MTEKLFWTCGAHKASHLRYLAQLVIDRIMTQGKAFLPGSWGKP